MRALKYTVRALRSHAVFSSIAIISLALAICANTTVFSVVSSLLYRMPAVERPDRIVQLESVDPLGHLSNLSYPEYLYYRNRNSVFSDLIAYLFDEQVQFEYDHHSDVIFAHFVSANYFSGLGVSPVLGRGFLGSEDTPGTIEQNAIVISYRCWQQRFGANADILGKSVSLNRSSFIIAGVAPKDFTGLVSGFVPEVWIPFGAQPLFADTLDLENRADRKYVVLGRLRHEANADLATGQLNVLSHQLQTAYPDTEPKARIAFARISTLPSDIRPAIVDSSRFLMAVVSICLLIACANLSGLLLSRLLTKRRDFAVRVALGARRTQLILPVVFEALTIAVLAGSLGLLLTFWTTRVLQYLKPPTLPFSFDFSPDVRVFGFAMSLAVASGLLFGVLPAWKVSGLRLLSFLRVGDGAGPRGRSRMLSALVVVQFAGTLVLLTVANVAVQSLRKVSHDYPGFSHSNILTIALAPKEQGHYSNLQMQNLLEKLVQRCRLVAGVEEVSLTVHLPFDPTPGASFPFSINGQNVEQSKDPMQTKTVAVGIVGPDYFSTLGIPLVNGREFTQEDRQSSPKVAIINTIMARTYWPKKDPVGSSLSLGPPGTPRSTIIGVASAGVYDAFRGFPRAYVYVPVSQQVQLSRVTLLVETRGDPNSFSASMQRDIEDLDPNLLLLSAQNMVDHVSLVSFLPRVTSRLFGLFGLLAFLLAIIGLYSLVEYTTRQRTKEFGIRVAMGAKPSHIMKLVLVGGLELALIGTAFGALPSFLLILILSKVLFGLSTTAAIGGMISVCLSMITVALVASSVPAYHAMAVEPVIALRHE